MRLSLAGFQVIMYGRFWVFTEVPAKRRRALVATNPIKE